LSEDLKDNINLLTLGGRPLRAEHQLELFLQLPRLSLAPADRRSADHSAEPIGSRQSDCAGSTAENCVLTRNDLIASTANA
jgi:hypothetical protein